MDKVVGIGDVGAKVAEEFTEHPEYRIYKIAPGLEGRADLAIDRCADMESYENNLDKSEVASYLRSIHPDDEVLVILEGGDPTNGIILSVLEEIAQATISVVYICPDTSLIGDTQKRDHRITFGVLQEYARSGVFQMMYLVDRSRVEEMLGDVSIAMYEQSVHNFISYAVVMINYFNHADPVVSTGSDISPLSRIATFGVGSLEEDSATKYLYELDDKQEEHFYYGIPSAQIAEDPTLMRQIKEQVKSFSGDTFSTSFAVFPTTFDDRMVISCAYTKHVQPSSPV